MIKYILSLFHIHYHNKLVINGYVSFNLRDGIYECRCGHRICERVRFAETYPQPTTEYFSNERKKYYLTPKNPITQIDQITIDSCIKANLID